MFMNLLITFFLWLACPCILPNSYWTGGGVPLDLKVFLKCILEILEIHIMHIKDIQYQGFFLTLFMVDFSIKSFQF